MKSEQTAILYTLGDTLYVNLTNRCPCRCTFCIRQNGTGVGTADTLWLSHEPSLEQVWEAFSRVDLQAYPEVVFCGYGEPTCALDTLLAVCRRIRETSRIPIRINTNGLGDLIHEKPIAPLLKGWVDTVSVSLNAPTREEYLAVTRPSFGERSFDAMLQFAQDCQAQGISTMFTVVDVLSPEQIEASRKLADALGIPLRVRTYSA